jgi:hypothetical protein
MNDVQPKPTGRRRRRELIEAIRLPHVSGKASAAWLLACFALTAALVPMAVRLPLWIDFEIVLAGWWVIWAAVLARLLYLGRAVSDDHRLGEPRRWSGLGDWPFPEIPFDLEGCAWALVLVALVGAAWIVVEVAVPLVAFLLYCLVGGMLAQILNYDHRCQGRLGRALGRGVLWATVYTAPLAVVVWLVHRIHGSRG